jgi:hypothetical protein
MNHDLVQSLFQEIFPNKAISILFNINAADNEIYIIAVENQESGRIWYYPITNQVSYCPYGITAAYNYELNDMVIERLRELVK